MALVKCPDCGKEVSDKAGKCPNCGFPIEETKGAFVKEINMVENSQNLDVSEENITKTNVRKSLSKKTIISIILVIVALIIGTTVYLVATADSRNYEAGQTLFAEEKYEEALSKFSALEGYKDSKEMVEKCEYELSVDGQFLKALSKGLMSRWDYSDGGYIKDYEKEEEEMNSDEYTDFLKNCVNKEMDSIGRFKVEEFEKEELGTAAKEYIDLLNKAIDTIGYYDIDYTKYITSWDEIYAKRSVYIRDFAEKYGMTVDEKHQKELDDFITNASVVDKQEKVKNDIENMISGFSFERTIDEWGYPTYKLMMENTTEYTFDYFYANISALDAEGNIIATGQASQIEEWKPGQKATVDAWLDTRGEVVDYSDISFTAHYQTGNYFE